MDDVYEPEKREIYKYANGGGKVVCADPLVMLGKLKTTALSRGKNIDELIAAGNPALVGGPKLDKLDAVGQIESWNALAMLDDISRETFGLVPYDDATGDGADMAHALGVLNHFNLWCEKKNQKPASPSTSPPSAGSTSAMQSITASSSV